jgi:hypothetical protein
LACAVLLKQFKPTMFSGIRARFCKWTPWETRMLAGLAQALAAPHRPVLQAQLDAVTKIQRIVGWAEIDLYVMQQGRVCWDGVPCFADTGEFRLARARTVGNGISVQSELTCLNGHLFCIESEMAVKHLAFRSDVQIQIYELDRRYAATPG